MVETLQDWITIQADTRPHASAVVMGDERVTYGQLDARSNQLARTLDAAGCRRGDRICLLMPNSPAAITALIAIHKAGCLSVPLDPAAPVERLRQIIERCECTYLLAGGAVVATLEELRTTVPIGWLGIAVAGGSGIAPRFTFRDVRCQPTARLQTRVRRDDPATIVFTPASPTPRGVVITHGNVIHFVEWARRHFGMSTADRISGHSPLHADQALFDIFGTFAAGAELHLVPADVTADVRQLAYFIRVSELTQWFSGPAVLEQLASTDAVGPRDFPTLQRVICGGGTLRTPALAYWMKRLPHVAFTQLYGPTETTIASAYHSIVRRPEPGVESPIGKPCRGEELLVLDDRLEAVPAGETGTLYIRGAGLSQGYWRDETATGTAFVWRGEGDRADRLYRTGDLARVGRDGLVYLAPAAAADDVKIDVVPARQLVPELIEIGGPSAAPATMLALAPRI